MAALALVVSASPPFECGGGTTPEARAAGAASSAGPAAAAGVAATMPAEVKAADVEVASPLLVLVPVVDAIDGGDG